jgi:hypothetical protein
MSKWVIVQSLPGIADDAEPRYVIFLFEPRGPRPWINGPDGGEDFAGYTESELRLILAEKHGLSGDAINAVIHNAKNPPVTTIGS